MNPPRRFPPLTPGQQQQVLAYRKIAADYARRLVISYERLVDGDEAESIAMLTLCRAAQLYDPTRAASGIWPLAKIMIRQRIGEAIHAEMTRSRGQCGGRKGARILSLQEAHPASLTEREALRVLVAWVSEDPARTETIDRTVAGERLTAADLDRLESLRAVLGLPSPEAVSVADAAQRMGRTPKELRAALTRGTVPGYRCGASWRVYLGAALRCAA